MELLPIFLFAVALSFDGFGVGVAYGIRGIVIPLRSLLVISLASATAMGLSMLAGHFVSQFVDPRLAEWAGALILVAIGIWVLYQTSCSQEMGTFSENSDRPNTNWEEPQVFELRIKSLGIIIKILRDPRQADMDRSGVISVKEAALLGIALAMDALGAGFGAAMAGFKPLLTPVIVGIVKFVLVSTGDYVGRRWGSGRLGKGATMLPGCMLIGIGIVQMLGMR